MPDTAPPPSSDLARAARTVLVVARSVVTLLTAPGGRIGRTVYWAGFIIIMALSVGLGALGPIGGLFALMLVWPQICIQAKRLHDINRSAWLMLIPIVVIIGSWIMAAQVGGAPLMMAMESNDNDALVKLANNRPSVLFVVVAPILVGFGFLFWVGLTGGAIGPNRFGPPPMWWSQVESELVRLGLRRRLQVR